MGQRFKKEDILTIPNGMSLFRLLLIPIIVWLYCGCGNYVWAAVMVALSGLTDIADGKVARRFHMVSDFGKILDPVADKLTQAALMICLASRYKWLLLLIVLFAMKESFMVFWGYLTLKRTNAVNSARWYGKAGTVVLYVVMLLLILFPKISTATANLLIVGCAVFMLLSLILYGLFYWKILRKAKSAYGKKMQDLQKEMHYKEGSEGYEYIQTNS